MSLPNVRWPRALLCLLVLWSPFSMAAHAGSTPPPIRIGEIYAGGNGDSRVQFVEFEVGRAAPSPLTGELQGPDRPPQTDRVLVTFHDAVGELRGIVWLSPSPPGGFTDGSGTGALLLATIAFENRTGLAADQLMPANLQPVDGMLCVQTVPFDRGAERHSECLAYGNYRGPEPSDRCGNPNGPPAPALVIAGAAPLSLTRFDGVGSVGGFDCFSSGNSQADFRLEAPSPTNAAGETAAFAALPMQSQGENLFRHELFGGNGRTCLTCHVDEEAFGLSPLGIADRFAAAPAEALFVAEREPELAELENSCLLRGGNGRGLVLENVDGFDATPVFRAAPHLLNIRRTAPYGLSGHAPDLRTFSAGAVAQHFPRTLDRNSDPEQGPLDFRTPSDFELGALETFMDGIVFPADGDLDQNRMMAFAIDRGGDATAINRGRLLVGGTLGKAQCFRCHGGPTRSKADGSLGTGAGNRTFDTGVSRLPQNEDDGCAEGPGDPTRPLPEEDGGERAFETAPLVGVARTAPFFHDASVATLREAVAFYNSDEFEFSPAGRLMPSPVVMTDQDIDDIVAFLEAISVDPSVLPECDDGIDNDGDGATDVMDDPGCESSEDVSEHALGLPCDDGIDNDADRLIDLEDPGCESPGDFSEATRDDVVVDVHFAQEWAQEWEPESAWLPDRAGDGLLSWNANSNPAWKALWEQVAALWWESYWAQSRQIEVVISGAPGFDLDDLDVSSLRVGERELRPTQDPPPAARERVDRNGDGLADLTVYFRAHAPREALRGTTACLAGMVRLQMFSSCDEI